VARWFAAGYPVEALVVDDTGFPKDGSASPCVARQYSGTLGKTANCQVGVSVHLVNEHGRARRTGGCSARRAGMTRRWPIRWPRPARGGAASGPDPDEVRHREKWRLRGHDQEMTGPGGWACWT